MRNHPGQAVEVESQEPLAGSQIVIRPAQLSDVPALLRLINGYAAKAVMLPRTEVELCEFLRDFLVATDQGELVGCGALHFYTQHMAELRSLAVSPNRTTVSTGTPSSRASASRMRPSSRASIRAISSSAGRTTRSLSSTRSRGMGWTLITRTRAPALRARWATSSSML